MDVSVTDKAVIRLASLCNSNPEFPGSNMNQAFNYSNYNGPDSNDIDFDMNEPSFPDIFKGMHYNEIQNLVYDNVIRFSKFNG